MENTAEAIENAEAKLVDEKLSSEVDFISSRAAEISITNDDEYASAGEFLKSIKRTQKQVTEYWEPLRVSTKAAYDNVLAQKKEMLNPLDKAEKLLKSKTGAYIREKEEKRRKKEKEIRRRAQEEMERKLAEAADAETAGDAVGADCYMAEAEVMEAASLNTIIKNESPKVSGVSTSKTWKITAVDSSKVPVSFNGVEIRPVDEKVVMRMIKASKGTIQIPGVTYEEDTVVSVRA